MTVERADVLPVGRYWQDFFGEAIPIATAWMAAQGAAGRVRVLTTEGSGALGVWMLFEVLQRMPWPQIELGAPTHAGPEIHTRNDTVSKPPPEKDPLDSLGDTLSSSGSTASKLVLAVALGAGAIVIVNIWSAFRGR